MSALKMTARNKAWIQGYACAVAIYIKNVGLIDTEAKEMIGSGLKYEDCIEAEVDPADLDYIFPDKKNDQRFPFGQSGAV